MTSVRSSSERAVGFCCFAPGGGGGRVGGVRGNPSFFFAEPVEFQRKLELGEREGVLRGLMGEIVHLSSMAQ